MVSISCGVTSLCDIKLVPRCTTIYHYAKKNWHFSGKQGYLVEFLELGVHIWHDCSTTYMFQKKSWEKNLSHKIAAAAAVRDRRIGM